MNKNRRLGRGLEALLNAGWDSAEVQVPPSESSLSPSAGATLAVEPSPQAGEPPADTIRLNVYDIEENPFQQIGRAHV